MLGVKTILSQNPKYPDTKAKTQNKQTKQTNNKTPHNDVLEIGITNKLTSA